MLVHTVKILHSELLSSICSRCAPTIWHRFINTSGIKEDNPATNVLPKRVEDNPAANVLPGREDLPYEELIREKEVEIHTCGKLYEKWRRERRYWTVPESDLTFGVKYIDTGSSDRGSCKPTVVSLHGSPGTYKEFFPVVSHLHKKGVRVIAPNFPGSDNLQPTKFRHTPEEKAEFVRDFLRVLRVPSVDLILCHSSALFPGLHLSMESKDISVNSLALVNPTGLEVPRLLRPVWLTKSLVRLSEFPGGYKLTEAIGRRLAKKPELKGGSFEEHFLSAFTLLHSSIPEQATLFQELLRQNFPVLLAFSHNDKLISKRTSYKMAQMMIDTEGMFYDKEGKAQFLGGINPFREVMVYENGSHFLFRTYPDGISEAISSFLFKQVENRAK